MNENTPYSGWNGKTENYNGNEVEAKLDPNIKSKREWFVKQWMNDLTLIEASKFEYENLPVNLPAWEIEQRLAVQGFDAVYRHPVYGIVTCWGSKWGTGIYNNAVGFTGSQATLGDFTGRDGVDCIIGYNTSRDKNYISKSVVGNRLVYYANILADIDLSLSMISVQARAMNTIGAKTDNAVNVINMWYKKLQEGETYVPLLETGVFADVVPMISKDCADARGMSADLMALKSSYLKQFYNWSGVSFIQKKAERMITDEVEADEDMLSINIYDQLSCRAEFIARVNTLFDVNIKVRVNNIVIT